LTNPIEFLYCHLSLLLIVHALGAHILEKSREVLIYATTRFNHNKISAPPRYVPGESTPRQQTKGGEKTFDPNLETFCEERERLLRQILLKKMDGGKCFFGNFLGIEV
jgi:hypothetical protein